MMIRNILLALSITITLNFSTALASEEEPALINSSIYGSLEKTNIEYMYLELTALKDYAVNNNLEALKYYAAINQVRLALLNDNEYTSYEHNEGVLLGYAAYVDWKNKQLTEKAYFEQMLSEHISPASIEENDLEWILHFNKLTGPIVGSALDHLTQSDQWKKEVVAGVSPNELLQKFYNMDINKAIDLFQTARNHYNFNLILKEISSLVEKIQNYNAQAGVDVVLDFPNNKLVVTNELTTSEGKLIDDQSSSFNMNVKGSITYQLSGDLSHSVFNSNTISYVFSTHIDAPEPHRVLRFKVPSNMRLFMMYSLHDLYQGNVGNFKNKTAQHIESFQLNGYNNRPPISGIFGNGTIEESNNQIKITFHSLTYEHVLIG